MKDYYQTLGVATDATSRQIKTAYRELAFKYHPDQCKDPGGIDNMKAINEAYAVLSHPQKRKEYDSLQHQYGDAAYGRFRSAYSEQDIFNGSDIHQIFEEMAKSFGIRGFDAIFKEYYGQNYKTRTYDINRPGFRVHGVAFNGNMGMPILNKSMITEKIKKITRKFIPKKAERTLSPKASDYYDVIHIDPELARTGGAYAYYLRSYSRRLVVKVPPGVREGQKIRLAGMGETGKNGIPSGDLYLKVSLKEPLLQRIKAMVSSRLKKS